MHAKSPEVDYHLCANKLLHQYGVVERRRRFPVATAVEELYDKEDQTPEAELADSMPLLERRQGVSRSDPRVSDLAGDARATSPERRQGILRTDSRVSPGSRLPGTQQEQVRTTHLSAAVVESEVSNYSDSVFSPSTRVGGLHATPARAVGMSNDITEQSYYEQRNQNRNRYEFVGMKLGQNTIRRSRAWMQRAPIAAVVQSTLTARRRVRAVGGLSRAPTLQV